MEKKILSMLGVFMLLFIAACSNSEDKDSGEASVQNKTDVVEEKVDTEEESSEVASEPVNIDEKIVGDWADSGTLYQFTADGNVKVTTEYGGGYDATYETNEDQVIIQSANELVYKYNIEEGSNLLQLYGDHNFYKALDKMTSEGDLQAWLAKVDWLDEEDALAAGVDPKAEAPQNGVASEIKQIASTVKNDSYEERRSKLSLVYLMKESFEPTAEQIKEFENYLIEEYKSGRYASNIDNDEYMLQNLFYSSVVKEYHREAWNDMFHFAGDFNSISYSFYIMNDYPGSPNAEFAKKKLDSNLADIEKEK